MKKLWNKILTGVLFALLLLVPCACGGEKSIDSMIDRTAKSLQKSFESDEKQVLEDEKALPAGSAGSDWTAMVLSFSGRTDAYGDYLERLEQYVGQEYEKKGCLSDIKATEYHRIGLTMLALGGDPSCVKLADRTVNLVADGTWNFKGGSPGIQGSNGLIYALILLDAKDYTSDLEARDIEQSIIKELLGYQKESGSFCIDNSLGGDIDITAMAVQALAQHTSDLEVERAVEKALDWLSGQLTDDVVFQYSGEGSAESSAQMILALCAVGIDPEEDERFQKDGKNVLDGMDNFRMKDGLYMHSMEDGEASIMATYQSLLALEAVQRLREDGTWIFDFTERE